MPSPIMFDRFNPRPRVRGAWAFQSAPPREGRPRRGRRRDRAIAPPREGRRHLEINVVRLRPRVRGDPRARTTSSPVPFQSAPPREGRPWASGSADAPPRFNPRPRVRGDRHRDATTARQLNPRPRVRGDGATNRRFQSAPPREGRHDRFQSAPPREGRRVRLREAGAAGVVSIRAPA